MSEEPLISEALKQRRWRAIQPAESAWVAANAGAGKTSLLRDRVLRLLLDGVPPDRILCLTFTKAAAAEMQGRMFETLAGWVSATPEALRGAIVELLGREAPAAAFRAAESRARQLFAEAVETPGGLKIQTIHAFAERLLHLLPVEAGVPVNFTVLDDAEQGSLCEAARRQVVLEAIRQPRSRLAQSFTTLTEVLSAQNFGEIARAGMEAWRKLARNGTLASPEAFDAGLEALFRLAPDLTEARLEERLFEALPLPQEARQIADRLRAHPKQMKTVLKAAARLEAFAATTGAMRISQAFDLVLTGERTPQVNPLPASVMRDIPGLDAFFDRWLQAVETFIAGRRKLRTLRQSRALGDFSRAMLLAYEALKAERRVLDFDDLIERLRRLLKEGASPWVMLKLDAAIEHILVDEAQDTSEAMWDIVSALADDFFSGEGQVKRPRSLFVVGDQKQSIFSFQGAEPRVFEEKRLEFAGQMLTTSNLVADPVRLNVSFRSAEEVLLAVDAVFADALRRQGLTSSGLAETHEAAFPHRPGLVECWPLEAPVEGEPASAGQRLAERIAGTIAGWLNNGETSLITGKPIRPGDILILVRTRGAFFGQIMRALSAAGVPLAGADRIDIQKEIAVCDLLAIAGAALLPPDDLTLATALKTPLFGLDDAALERLCRHRPASLRSAIAEAATGDCQCKALDMALARLEARAREMSPHDFFARLLIEECPAAPGLSGRRALLSRLGADAADALDAFLSDALAFEERHPASLALFLAAQEARAHEIKRDPETGGDRVRIMTVHGAKGLEAPIVFLTEAGSLPTDGREPNFAPAGDRQEAFFLWAATKDDEAPPLAEERLRRRAARMEEYRRLLYVGLTRARERLYVTGHLSAKKKVEPVDAMPEKPATEWPWQPLVAAGLSSRREIIERFTRADDQREALRWPPRLRERRSMPAGAKPGHPLAPPPEWLLTPLARESARDAIVPSRAGRHEAAASRLGPDARADARREGIFIHRLLQFLPRFAANERQALALDLARQEFGVEHGESCGRLVAHVLELCEHPAFAPFLTAEWRAEVSLAGWVRLPSGARRFVQARIDRLRVKGDLIELLDFKTGYRPETGPGPEILAQMAIYRALLREVFAAREIRCHLGWFALQRIETLADAQLDEAITRL
jgi:ATP-dependent helicase/nuclease subunit A